MNLSSASNYYRQQKILRTLAVRTARKKSADPARVIVMHQLAATALAVESGERMLSEQGIGAGGDTLSPVAFTSGEAAAAMVEATKTERSLDILVATLVNDAARSAMSAFITTRTENVGHVRYLSPPSCPNCAVLAGRWYRWSTGFDRHPGCDCQMVPTSAVASPDLVYDAREAFDNGQIHSLTKGQAEAIRNGADMSQVINAKRGVQQSTTIRNTRFDFTLEGTTRRGVYGKTGPAAGSMEKVSGERYMRTTKSRLTTDTINRVASDRAHARQLLKHYGYIR